MKDFLRMWTDLDTWTWSSFSSNDNCIHTVIISNKTLNLVIYMLLNNHISGKREKKWKWWTWWQTRRKTRACARLQVILCVIKSKESCEQEQEQQYCLLWPFYFILTWTARHACSLFNSFLSSIYYFLLCFLPFRLSTPFEYSFSLFIEIYILDFFFISMCLSLISFEKIYKFSNVFKVVV